MSDLKSSWDEILNLLSIELSEIAYKTWIKDLKPLHLSEDTLVLLAYEDFFRNQVKSRYEKIITVTASQVLNRPIKIKMIIPSENIEEERTDTYSPSFEKQSDKIVSNYNLKTKYVFQNFVVGESNRMAHAAAVSVAENPGSAFNPLFLYGNSGLGKTHLMHAIANYILEQNSNAKVLYASCEQFTNELISSIKTNSTEVFKEKYRSLDVLLIDDIQFISSKDATQEEFFHTFNDLFNLEKQIIISSDRHPNEIKTLTERLISRFSCGLIADIKIPDFETRTAIIEKKAESSNISIPKEVSQFIAQSVDSNIRVLEGALNRVIAYVNLTNQSLSVELAEEALKDIIKGSKEMQLSPESIKSQVALYYNIKIEDLNSQRRTKTIVDARQVAMYLCREILNETYSAIGKAFGRDHSTAMHAIEKVEKNMKENGGYNKEISDLQDKIKKR